MEITEENKKKLFNALFALLIILSAYFAVKIFSEIKKDSLLGESSQPATISFSGHGEVTAVPNIANIYFTITKDDKTVKDAQAGVAVIEKKALDLLKAKGVADKDIKTANASFNPKYEWRRVVCAGQDSSSPSTDNIGNGTINCPLGKQVLVGYTASESITVKIRKTDSVGEIMQGLGTTGISNLDGPNFAIDKEDVLKAQARKLAIDDAKQKAEILAKDLGVSLSKIVSFSENGNYPIMYAANSMMDSAKEGAPAPAVIPKGENTISSDVTITYEIR